MPTFILATRLKSELVGDSKGRRAAGKTWLKKVKAACPDVKWLAHYAILGRYDFLDIYEADNVRTAHRVSLISRSEGALEVETWPALDYDSFLGVLDDIKDHLK